MQLATLYHSHRYGYTMFPFWVPDGTTFDQIDLDRLLVLLGVEFKTDDEEFVDLSLSFCSPREIPIFELDQINFVSPSEEPT